MNLNLHRNVSARLLDVLKRPNPSRYAGQRTFVVRRDYCALVPYVEDEHTANAVLVGASC